MSPNIGEVFQKETNYYSGQTWAPILWSKKPEIYKSYPSRKKLSLSIQFPAQFAPFVELLKKRRSIRRYSSKALSINELSFLLWASTGIQREQNGFELRTVPSAGALYPIETYLVVNNVEELDKGLYHYSVVAHALEELGLGAFAERLAHAALDQEICFEAPVTFVWTAVFERSTWKYSQRAYRYVYLEAGHIAQNLALSATSIGLGSCQIGALFDEEINGIIGVDGLKESAIYLSVVGHPSEVSP
jgi:SagB-type dehydrogenase family enzyme